MSHGSVSQSADAALLLACDRSSPEQLSTLLEDLRATGLVPTAATAARVITRLADGVGATCALRVALQVSAAVQRQP